MDRLQRIAKHIVVADVATPRLSAVPTASTMSSAEKSDDDVVICCAVRTAIAKANRGGFKDTPCEEMLAPLFKAVTERTKLDPKTVGDIQIGNVSQPGAGAVTSRMAQFMGDLPFEIPLSTVNRQCSSGLQAVANIASSIRSGVIDVGIAGGVESMTMYNMASSVDPNKFSTKIADNDLAMSCLIPMGITSENVAEAYKISPEKQNALAVASHSKAIAAQRQGLFNEEIVPVSVRVKDKDGKSTEAVVKADEGPREGTTLEGLSKLKPAFKPGGSTTAGNSSQVSDGAAMVLLARRGAAKKLGLPILARMRSYAVVGVDPKLMGIGPAFAIPSALEKAGLTINDIDIFEINEAFASQATMSVEHLKVPMEKVNPKGGAIALGHPLGCTGSRQIATLLPELKRTKGKLGVVSMCIGTGMGAAGVIESEQ
uniref:acetyl-CoA C-acyltransferase n=1 Tax=Gambierdiscus polynesiensis TaxID=439318 RepID=A0A6M5KF05_9DINO|nr:3-ketoacyl thiolase [Gambierdiscus polynesiensis]